MGIDRDVKFVPPADMDKEINSADIMRMIDEVPPPGAEGEDQGVGKEQDFNNSNREYIPPESKPVNDDDKPKKDTVPKPVIKEEKLPDNEPKGKKKGFLQKVFGKKEKDQ